MTKNLEQEVLDILSDNAKISHEQIANMTNSSVEEIDKLISDLEKRRVIIGYTTLIDWEKTDREYVSAIIEVKVMPNRELSFDSIAERIYKFPEVRSVSLVAGDYDFQVNVEGRTMKDISLFVVQKLSSLHYIQGTATHFIMKRYKVNGISVDKPEKDSRLAVAP